MLESGILRVHLGRTEREHLKTYEVFIVLIKCSWGYDVKEVEMGWVCSTYETDWRFTKKIIVPWI
jgi:hypothetical protein